MYGIINYEVFLLAGILLNLIPGTDTMYILGRSISQGRQAGIYSVFGIITGAFVHTLLVAFGLSMILMKSVVLFNAIKLAGVIYLVYLGVNMLRDKTSIDVKASANKVNIRKIYMQGLLTSITNPKVALFFIAFLPQFIDTSVSSSPIPFILLGLTFATTAFIWSLFIAYFSSYVTKKLRGNQKVSMVINKVTGILFIGMGLKLLQTKAPQ